MISRYQARLGDIAVATIAIALSLFTRPDTRVGWGAVLAWNVFGFLDILFVVAAAAPVQRVAAQLGL